MISTEGNELGHAITSAEAEVLKITQEFGIGAQFGGKYFCHDVRVAPATASRPVASAGRRRTARSPRSPQTVFLEAPSAIRPATCSSRRP